MLIIPQLVDSDKQTNDWMKIRSEFLPYLQFPLVQALQIGLPANIFYAFCGNEEWHMLIKNNLWFLSNAHSKTTPKLKTSMAAKYTPVSM